MKAGRAAVAQDSGFSDADLLRRLRAGDYQAIAELHRRYFGDVFQYARSILRNTDDAYDACNEVFLSLIRYAASYEHQDDKSPRAWLFAIARSRVIDLARKRGRTELRDPAHISALVEANQPPIDPALVNPTAISDKDLLLLIGRLPSDQREALVLRYQLGLSTKEIARVLNRSPRAVNDLDFRARRFLEQRLTRIGRDAQSFRREWTRRRLRRAPVLRSRRFVLMGPSVSREWSGARSASMTRSTVSNLHRF